jgi:alpha-N-arabinofuranosidase
MGTQEFLTLCQTIGATPMITVNVITGTADEAAAWVQQANITGLYSSTGQRLPSVPLWEIGNEPYLDNTTSPPDVDITAAAFAAKVNQFVAAMKAVDPSIHVILPMRSDMLGGQPATPFPGFEQTVLSDLTVPVDYVAVHDAYSPAIFTSPNLYSDLQMYEATMAATNSITADLASIQSVISRNPYTQHAGITVTEYSALYTLPANNVANSTDVYIDTLAGALYVADVLRLFATTPNLSAANFWSLSMNWNFGSFDPEDTNGDPRPSFWTLTAYKQLLQGTMAPVTVQGPTFGSPSVGFVPAYTATPTVAAVASLQGSTLRVLIINKDPANPANLTLNINPTGQEPTGAMQYQGLTGPTLFSLENVISKVTGSASVGSFPIEYQAPAHSFVLLTVPLQ